MEYQFQYTYVSNQAVIYLSLKRASSNFMKDSRLITLSLNHTTLFQLYHQYKSMLQLNLQTYHILYLFKLKLAIIVDLLLRFE